MSQHRYFCYTTIHSLKTPKNLVLTQKQPNLGDRIILSKITSILALAMD
ncbi:hypothetical protein GNE10_20395 [Nostoc sp. 2RC]|nr:hypothetical protein [Nostoc sp. 2RC]